MLKIRPFEWKDAEALCERNNELEIINQLITAPPSTLEGTVNYFSERIANNDIVLIAEEDGKVAGSLEMKIRSGKEAHVSAISLAIKKEFWGRKIGSKLVEEAIKKAKQRKLEKLVYAVSSHNERSINLAKDTGFELAARLERNVKAEGKYYDLLIFEKLL
jgi:L-amino acid N-acyltransferase YncA